MKKANLLKALPLLLCPALIQAEIVTDGSLGVETSLAGPDFTIGADLGQQHGSNLFHSFSQFNIANGESATFSGPADIANIISRITGGSQSTIDGLLRSDITGANVFLLNPAGVMFGSNASLDISGSLYVSTGDSLIFENMEEFLATPLTGEVLSTAAPKAFGFLGGANGSIEINGAQLTLANESTLVLAANGIELLDNAKVKIDQGQVSLTSIGGMGEVDIETGEANGTSTLADISITNQSNIAVDGVSGGKILVQAHNIAIRDGSLIDASNSDTGDAGNVAVKAAGQLLIDEGGAIVSDTLLENGDFGGAGNITIDAETVDILNGGKISASSLSLGNAGSIALDVTGRLLIDEGAIISEGLLAFSGAGGSIDIKAETIEVHDDGQISVSAIDSGAGKISVNTTGQFLMNGGRVVGESSRAAAGEVEINAGSFEILDGAKISVTTDNIGPAGKVKLNAAGLFLIDGGTIVSDSLWESSDYSGDVGNIMINAEAVDILNGGKISASSLSFSNAGSIALDITGRLLIDEGAIVSDTLLGSGDSGNAGNITINAEAVDVLNNGKISASSLSVGDAGSIALDVMGRLLIDEGAIISEGLPLVLDSPPFISPTGAGGSIDIKAETIEVHGDGKIGVSAIDSDAGKISVNTTGQFLMNGGEVVGESSRAAAGEIEISAGSFEILDGAKISVTTHDIGPAGKVELNAAGLFLIDGAAIVSDSLWESSSLASSDYSGDVGNIMINAEAVDILNGGKISASSLSPVGSAGNIALDVTGRLLIDEGAIISEGLPLLLDSPPFILLFTGDGGSIDIKAETIEVHGDGKIGVSAVRGNAGNISVNTTGQFLMNGGEVVGESSWAAAGEIEISAGSFEILDGAKISVTTHDIGPAGKVELNAAGLFSMADGATITSETTWEGDAGDIRIEAESAEILKDAKISTSTLVFDGDAGDITIGVRDRLLIDGGVITSESPYSITAPVRYGEAGNIAIGAKAVDILAGGKVSTSTETAGNAGFIQINAMTNIELSDSAYIGSESSGAGNAGIYWEGAGSAGSITLSALGDVMLSQQSEISTKTAEGFDPQKPAYIEIGAQNLLLDQGSSISTTAAGQRGADAGDIQLLINESVRLDESAKIESANTGTGAAGGVDVSSGSLALSNNSNISTDAGKNASQAGSVILDITGDISLDSKASITSASIGAGSAGVIEFYTTGNIALDEAEVRSSNTGGGNAGTINLNASDDIHLLNGSLVSTETLNGMSANDPAFINLSARNLFMEGSRLTTSASGSASAGSIDLFLISGGLFLEQQSKIESANTGTGAAGSVFVSADASILLNNSSISTDAGENASQAGSVVLFASGDINLLNGSSVSTETVNGFNPASPAFIELFSRNLRLEQNASLSTSATGSADAGNISLTADKRIELLDGSRLSTESVGGGGGGIEILVNDLLYLQNSKITTNVGLGGGNGGDIFVDPIFITLNDSEITANAVDGNGGNITLIADYIQQSTDSLITASSELGIDGEIQIEALDVDVDTGEDNLTADFLDASQWAKQACAQVSGSGVSSFIVSRRPLRPSPNAVWSASPMD